MPTWEIFNTGTYSQIMGEGLMAISEKDFSEEELKFMVDWTLAGVYERFSAEAELAMTGALPSELQ